MLKNREVSCQVFSSVIKDLKENNVELSLLTQGLSFDMSYLQKPKNRISWFEYKQCFDNITGPIGYTHSDLIRLGNRILEAPFLNYISIVARSLYTLPEFLDWIHKSKCDSPGTQLLTCVHPSCSHDEENNFLIKFSIPKEYPVVPQFFWITLGILQVLPVLYGFRPINVKFTETIDGGIFRFQCPQGGGFLSGLRRRLRWPFSTQEAARELQTAHFDLHQQYRKLEIENKRLKRTKRRLNQAKKNAEEASQAKSDFLAKMSHELRTPLNGILGMNQLLSNASLSSEQKDYSQSIHTSAELLLQIINDMLDLSRIEADKIIIERKPFSPIDMLTDLYRFYEPIVNEAGLSFTRVQEVPLSLILLGDHYRIRQIILNLINNAIKFTPKGDIKVTSQYNHSQLILKVSDTGIGISPTKIENIFNPFIQEDNSSSRNHSGLGLGLAICKQLVELMNGEIKVTSSLVKGTQFQVTLPLKQEKPHFDSTNQTSPLEPKQLESLDILVAEDNLINQKILEKMLTKDGHKVTLVENGIEAVKSVEGNHFDIVLMDIMMPKMDGVQATETIRKKFSFEELPIVAVTAKVMPEAVKSYHEAGMNQCLAKPLKWSQLRIALEQWVPQKIKYS